jgi:broad specificity phosphatase PhoE
MDADPKQQVVLIRHGATEWSAAGRHTGRTDVPLTDAGRKEASAIATRLRDWSFAAVLSSPLRRASETCRIAGMDDRARIEENLREWDYGEYEGLTTKEIRVEIADWAVWTHGTPNGERAGDVGRRADRVLATVRSVQGDVALFSHGHFLRVLAARWCGFAPIEGRRFRLDTGTISILGFERETPVIRLWNDDCHRGGSP